MNETQGTKPDLITYSAAISVLFLQLAFDVPGADGVLEPLPWLAKHFFQAACCSEGLPEDTCKGAGSG